tara:strand:- start:801 stop:1073 length:273 start_codon:yes stop_codon:yes gene_type:complete
MAISLLKQSDQPSGLPTFYCEVETVSAYVNIDVRAVSATDACLKAAYNAVRNGHTPHGKPVKVTAWTPEGNDWLKAERTVTPTGRTGGAA